MLNQTVLPQNAFESLPGGAFGTAAAAGSAAIGLFFAFWSWVGFETTAVYGEESRNPKKIVPRATLIAVIGLGLFYTFISAMVIAGNGKKASVESSISANPPDLLFKLVDANLGGVLLDIYKILLVIGSFACAMAFHNAASRYIFALGREIPVYRSAKDHRCGASDARLPLYRVRGAEHHHAGAGAAVHLLHRGTGARRKRHPRRHPDTRALRQHLRSAGADRHGGDPAGAGDLLGSGDLVLLGQEDAQGQRDHHADLSVHRRRRHVLRRLAAVGQPCLRSGLRGELGCVQSRPVPDLGDIRHRHRVRRCGCVRPSPTNTPRSAAPCWRRHTSGPRKRQALPRPRKSQAAPRSAAGQAFR